MLEQACATCVHVLSGEGVDCISNCGGDLSVTCEADIDFENAPEIVKFVHLHHIIKKYPDLKPIVNLPINTRVIRTDSGWDYENERYEEPYEPNEDDIVCVDDEKTLQLVRSLLSTEIYYFARLEKVAFMRLYSELQVPAIFSTKSNAQLLQDRYFSQYSVEKIKFEKLILILKKDFNFFLFDFDDGDFFPVHLLNIAVKEVELITDRPIN